LGYKRVFEADRRAGKDGLVGSEQAALAEVFEDVQEHC
jgi:hypothetical protein